MMCKIGLGLLPMLMTLVLLSPLNANAASSRLDVRTSCDSYGRCFEFGGPDDLLASESGSLRERFGLSLAPNVTGDVGEED